MDRIESGKEKEKYPPIFSTDLRSKRTKKKEKKKKNKRTKNKKNKRLNQRSKKRSKRRSLRNIFCFCTLHESVIIQITFIKKLFHNKIKQKQLPFTLLAISDKSIGF